MQDGRKPQNINDVMTEREVLDIQEKNGNQEFLLILIGSFLHAYGYGAFALARATGYRVLRKQRKWGEVLTCGFPISKLDDIRQETQGDSPPVR